MSLYGILVYFQESGARAWNFLALGLWFRFVLVTYGADFYHFCQHHGLQT